MKNYSGLYSNNKSSLNSKATRNKLVTQNPFIKTTSIRNLKPPRTNKISIGTNLDRYISKSIEQLPTANSKISGDLQRKLNFDDRPTSHLENAQQFDNDDQQLFGESFNKINKMKAVYNKNHQIEKELTDILILIKKERAAINVKLEEINLNSKPNVEVKDQAVNTEDLIPQIEEKTTRDQEVQTHKKQDLANDNLYQKLVQMLHDMNINCKDILPDEIQLKQLQLKDYRELSESEIIKIQKFFIKKLAQKIPY